MAWTRRWCVARHRTRVYTLEVIHHVELAWPKGIRQRLLAAMAPASTSTEEICQLNFLVGRQFYHAVEKLLAHSKTAREKITAIGSHGQTICHIPPVPRANPGPGQAVASTLQIGDVSVIATLTGIITVGNFRTADVALGGQGAPLVPFADRMILTHATKSRAAQNIGGIANVTYLPPLAGREGPGARRHRLKPELQTPVIAFDTGPGNMLLDAVVLQGTRGRAAFDRNGWMAAKGELDKTLFRELQALPYFSQRPPKSTGRELFGTAMAATLLARYRKRRLSIENLLHTLTRLTAWSIADAYVQFLPAIPDEVILCGGGAENLTLVEMLREEFQLLTSEFTHPAPPAICRIDEFGIPNKAKEAASFALLAAATLDRVPGNLPSVTGASRAAVLGQIALP